MGQVLPYDASIVYASYSSIQPTCINVDIIYSCIFGLKTNKTYTGRVSYQTSAVYLL